MSPAPRPESGYVSPSLASVLSGLTPCLIRNLALIYEPRLGEEPQVRSIHRGGWFLVHLGDAMLVAGAMADSGVANG